MPLGVLFALMAYGIYACGDAVIKGFSGQIGVFEIAFFTAAFSAVPMIFCKRREERWSDAFRMVHPWLSQLRAVCGVSCAMLGIYAFTTIPLAEAYAIAFLAPVFVTVISVLVLRETVSLQRWILLLATFAGVLIVVRPGFRELQLGHLSMLGAALLSSVNTILLRKIAPHETRMGLFSVLLIYTLGFNGIMMLGGFTMPDLTQFALLAAAGVSGGIGQLLFISATRLVPASQVAPAHYSQILWAVIFGATFFNEVPDSVAVVGLVLVVCAGLANVVSDETRKRTISRIGLLRGRQAARVVAPVPANDTASPTPQTGTRAA
ncbi:membrane protein [Devosia pacifica]|uniref:Membrane protein n=1 Tax=Devosia pacifica TaxID=1335967 RepID=A0A918RX14_9HYPH|nr:DMT family transporter [Devosia pacifica]GHA14484.1 membrane protein [Devosia pacifica]